MTVVEDFPAGRIAVCDTAMDLKCATLMPYIRFLQDKFGAPVAKRAVAETRMNWDYVQNEHNWVSYSYACRLLQKLVEVTGDSRAPYEAARSYTDTKSFRVLASFLLHLGSPTTTYKLVAQFHGLWDRISEYRILQRSATSCVIRISLGRHQQDRNNCLAIQGSLASAPHPFGLPSAHVEELQCACDGADACVYRISWIDKPRRIMGSLGFTGGLAVGVLWGTIVGWNTVSLVYTLLFSLVGYHAGRQLDYKRRLAQVYRRNEEQATSLLEAMQATEQSKSELQQKVEERTAELSTAKQEVEQALRDLKQSREKELAAERQAVVGVLAGGMAHEVNSPINAIRMTIQFLLETAQDESLRKHLLSANRAAARCKRIVSELLSFSRDPMQTASVRLEEIVEMSTAVFLNEHPGELTILKTIARDLPAVTLDKLQIQQALLNLLSNAGEAMEGKGKIEVSLWSEGANVALVIKDHGPGMTPEVQAKVFDPFFTTKTQGRGLGLGLAITCQLVKRNGGTIELASQKGQGATFTIRFPVPATPPATPKPPAIAN